MWECFLYDRPLSHLILALQSGFIHFILFHFIPFYNGHFTNTECKQYHNCFCIPYLPDCPPSACPGAPINPHLQVATPPDVVVGWSPPPTDAAWPLQYQVKWPNGTVIADGLNTTSVVIEGVNHLSDYTVNVTAFTDSSCMDRGLVYTFTTGESECMGWRGVVCG